MSLLMPEKPEWYVIQVLSWSEENVKQSLFQRRESFNLQDMIIEVKVPSKSVTNIRAWWKKVTTNKNVFPGYILVKMLITDESWYIVRNTPNVTWFLWAWTVPVPVTDEEYNKLTTMLANNTNEINTKFKVWDFVRVTEWTFKWSDWVIIELNKKTWSLKLNINLLWRDVPTELDLSQISELE